MQIETADNFGSHESVCLHLKTAFSHCWRKKMSAGDQRRSPALLRSRRLRLFDVLVRRPLKWIKMFSYYLIQSEREAGGGLHALGSSVTEPPLLALSAAVTHFNSTLFLSHWNSSTMTFNKGRRVKTWLFLHILSPRLGRGPSKGINQCSLTALPSGDDLSLFCGQKWHINLKLDMHKLYMQLSRLCFCAQAKEAQQCRRPAARQANKPASVSSHGMLRVYTERVIHRGVRGQLQSLYVQEFGTLSLAPRTVATICLCVRASQVKLLGLLWLSVNMTETFPPSGLSCALW